MEDGRGRTVAGGGEGGNYFQQAGMADKRGGLALLGGEGLPLRTSASALEGGGGSVYSIIFG